MGRHVRTHHAGPIKVTDADGRHIAYFVPDVGWLEREVVEDPSFDIDAQVDRRRAELGLAPPDTP